MSMTTLAKPLDNTVKPCWVRKSQDKNGDHECTDNYLLDLVERNTGLVKQCMHCDKL